VSIFFRFALNYRMKCLEHWYRSWNSDTQCVEINVCPPQGVNYVMGSCSGYFDQVPGAGCTTEVDSDRNANIWSGSCVRPAGEPLIDQKPAIEYPGLI